MSKLVDKITPALLAAAILGGVEMRVAVARLETRIADIDKRVERIENIVYARPVAALEIDQ